MAARDDKNNSRAETRIVYLILVIAFSYLAFLLATAGIGRVITLATDDCGYYLEIAENVAGGRGFTFDGIHTTNGFQPLWLLTVAFLHKVFGGPPEAMLRVAMIFQAGLLLAAGFLFYPVYTRIFSGRTGLISSIIFTVLIFFTCVNCMESAVLVFMIILLFLTGWKGRVFERDAWWWQLIFGIVLGLTVLARLDTVFLAMAIFLFLLVDMLRARKGTATRFRRLMWTGLGAALVIVPYLSANIAWSGSIMPVSGALKSSFPRISGSAYALSRLSGRDWIKIAGALIYLIWYPQLGKIRGDRPEGLTYFRASLAFLSVAVLLHTLHTVLFMKWAVFRWHFITYSLLGIFVISEPIEYLISRRWIRNSQALFWGMALILVAAGCLGIYRKHTAPLAWTVESYEAALWARENTEKLDAFAMKDAGIFGYFSGRKVINLDGVVNDREFQEVLRKKGLREYLFKNNVRYIVQHAVWNRDDVVSGQYETFTQEYPSRRYDRQGDSLLLERENEVYRSPPYRDGPYRTVFLIWELTAR